MSHPFLFIGVLGILVQLEDQNFYLIYYSVIENISNDANNVPKRTPSITKIP